MLTLARAALTAAVACLVATATPGQAYLRRPEVLLLGGQFAKTVSTARTDPGLVYVVSVSGVVSYNGRGTLLDCGHFDSPDEAGWRKTSYPLLDGVQSPCTDQPVSFSHTYCWVQGGTGEPLVFTMPAKDTEDDLGGLVVTVDPYRRTCPSPLP